MSLECLSRNIHAGGRDDRWQVLDHGVLLQRALGQVARELDHGAVGVGGLEEAAQKRVRGGHREVILEGVDNVRLHFDNLLLVVCAVGDVHQVSELGWVYLLVLACEQQRRHAHELQLGAANLLELEIPINKIDGQIQGFRHHLEFEMNFNLKIIVWRTKFCEKYRLNDKFILKLQIIS